MATRAASALTVALGFHLAALVPLALLVLATGGLAHVTGAEVAVFVALGAVGWLAPIFLARAFTAVFLAAHASRRGGLAMSRPTARLVVLIAVLDTGGYACFNLGVRHGATAVVATASALYALVPVALGVRLLRERPSRAQWAGLAVVGGGLVLLGIAG